MNEFQSILLALLSVQWLILTPFLLKQLLRLHNGRHEPFIARRHHTLTVIFSISFVVFCTGFGAWAPMAYCDLISQYPPLIARSLVMTGYVFAVSAGAVKIYAAFYDHFYNMELADLTWHQVLSERSHKSEEEYWYLKKVDTWGNPRVVLSCVLACGMIAPVVTQFSPYVGEILYFQTWIFRDMINLIFHSYFV